MSDKTPENIEFPADLRNIKRPKSFNKKKGKKDKQITTPEYNAPVQIPQQSTQMEMDAGPDQENQYQAPIWVEPDIVVESLRQWPETSETSEILQPTGPEFE